MSSDRNIVVVMSDDHGQWCSGAYGNQEIHTPTLDYLAESGVRMENAFCPSPVCSPSRASFFTGRRPSQHGIHDWIRNGSTDDGPHWLDDEVTLPELLAEAGYTTGLAGKWHCGHGRDDKAFDSVANMHHDDWSVDKFSLERDRHITESAIEFLREGRDSDEPFFLFVGYTATHVPWDNEPERLVSNYRTSTFEDIPDEATYRYGRTNVMDPTESKALPQYYAAVQGIDEQVGRLYDELVDQGVETETLFVYTADHGHNCGHHGFWGKGNGTNPQNMVEESIRVPLLIGGHTDLWDGQVRDEFVDHCDLFQTLLSFADVDRPDDRRYSGESFLSQLTHADGRNWNQHQYCEYGDVRALRTQQYKLVRRCFDAPNLLFDLKCDPRETTNVYDDPAYEAVVERLNSRLEAEVTHSVTEVTDGSQTESLPSYNDGAEPWNNRDTTAIHR